MVVNARFRRTEGTHMIGATIPRPELPPAAEPDPFDAVPDGDVPGRRGGALGGAALLLAAALAGAVPMVSASGTDLPGRPLLGLAYVLTVPGVAVAALLRLPSRLASWVLAVATSLGALLLLATAQLVTGLWSPVSTQVLLSAAAVVATIGELLRPPALPSRPEHHARPR
jgi:hypothetical protein